MLPTLKAFATRVSPGRAPAALTSGLRWRALAILLAGLLVTGVLLLATPARAATGTIQDVQHVVILAQENRSFDHYFGTLQGVCGFNDPNILRFPNGASDLFQPSGGNNFILPFPVTSLCINDVDHGEASGLGAWNNGRWNQWIPQKGPNVMAYYTRTNLPFYYALADAYTLCDANFCSFVGPTFPNRLYLFTGTVDPGGTGGGPVLYNHVPTNGYSWTTYPERLQAAGVSWRVYRPGGDWFGDALPWFAQYMKARPGNPLYDRGLATVNNVIAAFKSDVTNGTLPQVSWIIPTDLSWSEHPPDSIARGEWFVQQIMNALTNNPAVLNSTVFIITYDENGGFYDHVPPPVPPPGTPGEFVNGQPLGLGVRVPLFLISPWTRGGRVCSQVFDHTSILRFLEAWTGVAETNISAWRRQTCGDLTSAFDFAHPDFTVPGLPVVPSQNCSGVTPAIPLIQSLPVQEPGSRPACPLPYQPDAAVDSDCNSNRVSITLTNAGAAAVHFAIYANAFRTDGPWQYDAPAGGSVKDSFVLPAGANGQYDLTCYGPNGFQRRFAGNLNQDCRQLEIASRIDAAAGALILQCLNAKTVPVNFSISNHLDHGASAVFLLPPGGATDLTIPVLTGSQGWYDVTVTADADTNFVRRLAGHIELGSFSFTAPPAIVGNVLGAPADAITLPPLTGINSITDEVNALIANNGLATAGTNNLALVIGAYGTNCALIYPGWASNYVVESSLNLAPPWNPLGATGSVVSNCDVIILPETNTMRFFRLRK